MRKPIAFDSAKPPVQSVREVLRCHRSGVHVINIHRLIVIVKIHA